MAPAGFNTFNGMVIPSVYSPFLSTLNSSSLHSGISSKLSTILSDHAYFVNPQAHDFFVNPQAHDYFVKPPQAHDIGHSLTGNQEYCDFLEADERSSRADVMLNCSDVDFAAVTRNDVDFAAVTGDSQATDFLTDLDELDFGLGDLDPCNDVEMEDSFQEFIDSALEESSTFFSSDRFQGDAPQQHDDVTAQKEEFFANLDLSPVQTTNVNTGAISSLPLSSTSSVSHLSGTYALQDATSPTVVSKDTTTFDAVPTKVCSCLDSDTVTKAVYSTAHLNHHDSVRTCPSSVFTQNNECSNCKTDKRIPERLMSPLFIDTSLTGCYESFAQLSDDRLHVAIDKDQLSEVDKDTADIMKWLKDNQQSYQLRDGNNNNNSIIKNCHNGATYLMEASSQRSSVDLETFVDLDDFLNKAEDTSVDDTAFHHYCHRTTDQSYLKNKDVLCHSQLKLSFLEEIPARSWDDGKQMCGPHSDIFCEGLAHDNLTPKSSHFSECSSPAWSEANSAQSSPLGSTNFSLSSNWEDVFEDSSLKSQLALLKLFSEENAESLLVTDSPLPKARFV